MMTESLQNVCNIEDFNLLMKLVLRLQQLYFFENLFCLNANYLTNFRKRDEGLPCVEVFIEGFHL